LTFVAAGIPLQSPPGLHTRAVPLLTVGTETRKARNGEACGIGKTSPPTDPTRQKVYNGEDTSPGSRRILASATARVAMMSRRMRAAQGASNLQSPAGADWETQTTPRQIKSSYAGLFLW